MFQLLTTTMLGFSIIYKIVVYALVFALTIIFSSKLSRRVLTIQMLLAFSALLMFPLSGHAYAANTLVYSAIMMHFIHMLTAICWFGGLAGIASISWRTPVKQLTTEHLQSLHQIILRFSAWALPLLIISLITGVASAFNKFDSFPEIFSSTYGLILLVKTLLFLTIFIIAAIHRVYWIPRLSQLESDAEISVMAKMLFAIRVEVIIAMVAFVLAGLLAVTAPPF
jgi:putative copper export protein